MIELLYLLGVGIDAATESVKKAWDMADSRYNGYNSIAQTFAGSDGYTYDYKTGKRVTIQQGTIDPSHWIVRDADGNILRDITLRQDVWNGLENLKKWKQKYPDHEWSAIPIKEFDHVWYNISREPSQGHVKYMYEVLHRGHYVYINKENGNTVRMADREYLDIDERNRNFRGWWASNNIIPDKEKIEAYETELREWQCLNEGYAHCLASRSFWKLKPNWETLKLAPASEDDALTIMSQLRNRIRGYNMPWEEAVLGIIHGRLR